MPTATKRRKHARVYSFDELTGEARERALNWARSHYQWDEADTRCLKEFMEQELEQQGFGNSEVFFCLNGCQGDGVAFHARPELDEIAEHCPAVKELWEKFWVLARMRCADEPSWKVIVDHRGRYTHYNSMTVSVEVTDEPDELRELTDEFAPRIEKAVDARVKEIAKHLEKLGYEEIDYKESDEYLIELMELNDNLFTCGGRCIDFD